MAKIFKTETEHTPDVRLGVASSPMGDEKEVKGPTYPTPEIEYEDTCPNCDLEFPLPSEAEDKEGEHGVCPHCGMVCFIVVEDRMDDGSLVIWSFKPEPLPIPEEEEIQMRPVDTKQLRIALCGSNKIPKDFSRREEQWPLYDKEGELICRTEVLITKGNQPGRTKARLWVGCPYPDCDKLVSVGRLCQHYKTHKKGK